jgi:hypothetical protein
MRALALVFVLACGRGRAPTCERSIAGLDARIAPGAILWFGEMHGTEESPRFVGDVACRAAQRGRVQVGLEIPNAEQAQIDRYLASDGKPADRAALLDGGFWRIHDGRSSEAMAALFEHVRVMRAAGAIVDVIAYDVPEAFDRDAAMADLVARERDPKAVLVGLSGNFHSRRVRGKPAVEPMVARLVARGFSITTFDVAANGGTFWACMDTGCGIHDNEHADTGEPWTLGPPRDASHDGVYRVGKTQASLPARPD